MKKIRINVDGREFEVAMSEEILQRLIPEYNKTGYEIEDINQVSWIDRGDGCVRACSGATKKIFYDAGNIYSSNIVAENNARADRLMRLLRRFSALHREKSINWDAVNTPKWSICYNYDLERLESCSWEAFRSVNTVYFDSLLVAEAAIAQFEDELIWYFTEYCDIL